MCAPGVSTTRRGLLRARRKNPAISSRVHIEIKNNFFREWVEGDCCQDCVRFNTQRNDHCYYCRYCCPPPPCPWARPFPRPSRRYRTSTTPPRTPSRPPRYLPVVFNKIEAGGLGGPTRRGKGSEDTNLGNEYDTIMRPRRQECNRSANTPVPPAQSATRMYLPSFRPWKSTLKGEKTTDLHGGEVIQAHDPHGLSAGDVLVQRVA